jgi:hypothetical protein
MEMEFCKIKYEPQSFAFAYSTNEIVHVLKNVVEDSIYDKRLIQEHQIMLT